MTKPIAPEARFAKHRLLPEIGARGQDRLCATRFAHDPSDAGAAFAAILLERSGLTPDAAASALIVAPPRAPRDAALGVADDAIRGAIAAVQQIREIVALPGAANTLRDLPREGSR